MYIPLTVLFLVPLGALLGYGIVKARDYRAAKHSRNLRDAEEAAEARFNSPYRVACSACGAAVGEICKALGGGQRWEPHVDRMRALSALRKSESWPPLAH